MIRVLVISLIFGSSAAAGTLNLPANATQSEGKLIDFGSYEVALGPFENGKINFENVEGQVNQQSWRIAAEGVTTLQLLEPLRTQLENDGFDVLFECRDIVCGGFDFRYGMDVLPEPAMHVDLGDFRYLAARRTINGKQEFLTLLVSRSNSAGFVQITRVGAAQDRAVVIDTSAAPSGAGAQAESGDIISALLANGFTELRDLAFRTGSSQLSDNDFVSLTQLAEFLNTNPDKRVALVGHTDSEGSLSANIALSKRRAASVLERLATRYNVNRRQMEAEGMGYLSPIASNLTEEGREANRRVEVIITSTQ